MIRNVIVGFLLLRFATTGDAFSTNHGNEIRSYHSIRRCPVTALRLTKNKNEEECSSDGEETHKKDWSLLSRRRALSLGVLGTTLTAASTAHAADDAFRPAIRPTAYRVDSTRPPTLLPLDARGEIAVLKGLGKGSGTSKDAVLDDRINFNNMLNKAVFGTIDAVSSVVNPQKDDSTSGPGYASFVCLGLPSNTTSEDVDLCQSLLTGITKGRKDDTAVGLAFAPLSTQEALDVYKDGGSEDALVESMTRAGVEESTVKLYMPLMQFAKSRSLSLLALAPEVQDLNVVKSQGLQNVNVTRRAQYVVDSEGFISLTQDPKFRLYTDRSLIKDLGKNDNEGNFFAERILVHEAAATAAARYATTRPDSLVALVAPTPDVRFMGGINGRIPRVCEFFNKEANKVTDEAVTTILLNPTAKETLSLSRYLRLEIGTAPENIQYQSKVADYLWFSRIPKVNMIPRLMNK